MNKQLTIIMRTALVALIAMMFFSTSLFAFAGSEPALTKGTPDAPATAGITKRLEMPVGTTTPNMTFTFEFKKEGLLNGTTLDDSDLAKGELPAIPNATAVITSANVGSTTGGLKTVICETPNFVPTANNFWPHAGLYVYTVTEKKTDNGITLGTTPFKESLTYSDAKYKVIFYVKEGHSTLQNKDILYVSSVGARIEVKDPSQGSTVSVGDKVIVDITNPGKPNDPTVDHSKAVFTNVFSKVKVIVDPSKDYILRIKHEVIGDYPNKTLPFTYIIGVGKPDTEKGSPTYTAYLINGTDKTKTTTDIDMVSGGAIKTDSEGYVYVEFTPGTDVTLKFKQHGQWLSFTDLPVGSTFKAEDQGNPNYKASYILTVNGAVQNGGKTPQNPNVGEKAGFTNQRIGEAANSGDFTNDSGSITETGINLDNAPYVAMIVIIALGMVGYVAYRSRKNAGQRSF